LPKRIILENIYGLFRTKFSPSAKLANNFEEWIIQRFGTGIAKNFMLPFNRKVWATELRSMNYQWIEERIQEPRFRDVFRGIFSKRSSAYGPNATFWYPQNGGTSALPDSFLPFINHIEYGERCTEIDTDNRTLHFQTGKKQGYETLISSLPLPRLVASIKKAPQKVIDAANKLKANRVTTVNLGIDREKVSDRHWVYFPEEQFVFQRISFPMNFSSSLVPPGTSSIMAEISSSDYRPLPESDVVEKTIDQLIQVDILRKTDAILVKKVVSIEPAYIIYTPDHRESVDTIHCFLRGIGIIPCGRFGEWEYLNMDQTILSGKRAAEEVNNNS
jgi:UDP-galactopyranose mutase